MLKFFAYLEKKYFYFFCPNLRLPQSRAHKQQLRVHMAFPTSAEVKAKFFGLLREHWPVCIVLFLVCFTSLFLLDDGIYLVLVGGAVGVVIFLPLFRLENCLWLYIAAFLLSGVSETRPD